MKVAIIPTTEALRRSLLWENVIDLFLNTENQDIQNESFVEAKELKVANIRTFECVLSCTKSTIETCTSSYKL